MNCVPNLNPIGPGLALLVWGTLIVLALWLSWRKPTVVLMFALAALALRPHLLWGGPRVGYEWGLHQTLLVFALGTNAFHYGIRRTVNWPILTLLAVSALSLLLGDLEPRLTPPFVLMSLGILALPFGFTQVVLAPGSRQVYGAVIMAAPLLSVLLGGLLQLAEIRTVFSYSKWLGESFRLEGATGDAAVFAMLAFTSFAVAVHEWTRPRRPHAIYLAFANLSLVILSGTRMAVFASAVFVVTYVAHSQVWRAHFRARRLEALAGALLVMATLVLYGPTLIERLFAEDGQTIALSGRRELWTFYWQEFVVSPLFGRGPGAGFIGAADWYTFARPTPPHNEYLHLLVIGGVVGFVLIAGAVVLWYRQLFQATSHSDRVFLLALAPALSVYAITDNVLVYTSSLALYTYLGVLLTRPLLIHCSPRPQAGNVERPDVAGKRRRRCTEVITSMR
jgi:O-antigen ligase